MRSVKSLGIAGILCLGFVAQAYSAQKIITFSSDITPQERINSVQRMGGQVVRELRIINAVAAVFPLMKASFSADSAAEGVQAIEEDRYIKWIESEPKYLSDIPFPSVDSIIENLTSPEADTGSEFQFTGITPAGDSGEEIPWGITRVNAPGAWPTTQGAGVRVAVVDTGIDLDHPELAAIIKGGFNSVESSSAPEDDHGHGTHVAGIIAAIHNSEGVVGVAPQVSLYAVKVLDANGGGTYSGVIAGIQWCAENKMDVLNMSLGGSTGSEAMANAIKAAHDAGVTIVCAAGNSGGAVSYPAKYPEAIAVSASTSKDAIAYFSSRGPEIDFIAPGVSIYSTYIDGGYGTMSGTSMACPHVTGLAALVVATGITNPDLVKKALADASAPLEDLTVEEQGSGMIDAAKFIEENQFDRPFSVASRK